MYRTYVLATSAALLAAGAALAQPNLVPDFNTTTGTVTVVNDSAARVNRRSIATVSCAARGGGSCPEPTAAQAGPYEIAGYPNVAAIRIRRIRPNKAVRHRIRFFHHLVFAPGQYVFTVCVDAGSHIAESNEGDNCARFVKNVR